MNEMAKKRSGMNMNKLSDGEKGKWTDKAVMEIHELIVVGVLCFSLLRAIYSKIDKIKTNNVVLHHHLFGLTQSDTLSAKTE